MAPRQRGFTMIEVLVSLVIAVIGLLGLIGIQAFAHQAELESYQRAQALVLMNDMVERMNSNRQSSGCYNFASNGLTYLGTDYSATPSCASGFLNTQTRLLANADLDEWSDALKGAAETSGGTSVGAMVGARGCVTYDATTKVFTVIVTWQGMTDTFAPVVTCANNMYGAETRRRAVWTTLRIATLT